MTLRRLIAAALMLLPPAFALAADVPTVSPSPCTTQADGSYACGLTIAVPAAVSTGYVLVAREGDKFTLLQPFVVRYGAGDKWSQKTVAADQPAQCSNDAFGGDPAYGVVKACEIVVGAKVLTSAPSSAASAAAPMPAAMSMMPAVDVSKIPPAAAGYGAARVQAANVADPSQNPVPSDIGAFREYCEFSHMSYDDPIVFPGKDGAHLHTFLGNSSIDRNTTAASITTTGNSTCAGGTLNRTGYWVPSMIDTQDGAPQRPVGSLIYYKQGYHGVTAASIKPLPAGLRMIAGSAASVGEQGGAASFTCNKPDGSAPTTLSIPSDCPSGSTLTQTIYFPQCWDGVNLDSPNHKSHMAYAGDGCPSTHPVPLVEIQMHVSYAVAGASGTKNWRLSSDNYDKLLPGGYSSHGDWFNGWDTSILNTWTTRCINASMDCHAFLIGDGRILY